MLLDRFNKQPNDRKKYQIDFSDWVDNGIVVSSVTPSVEVLGSGDDPTPLLVEDGDIFPDGTTYVFFVTEGTNNRTYKVTFLVEFTDTQIKEWEVEYRVCDK